MNFFSPPPSPMPNGLPSMSSSSTSSPFTFSQLPPQKPPQSPIRVQSPPMGVLMEEDEEEEEEEENEEKDIIGIKEEKKKNEQNVAEKLAIFHIFSIENEMAKEEKEIEEEAADKMAFIEEQALRLFTLCDKDSKGFIVRSDLENLQLLISTDQFLQVERAFDLADRYRVNLVYEKDFLTVIKQFLLGKVTKNTQRMEKGGITEFRNVSLDTDNERKSSSGEEWSPTRKLTIAIDSDPCESGGGGLAANLGRDEYSMTTTISPMGYLGGISPSSKLSEYWHSTNSANGERRNAGGSYSPAGSQSGISLYDELLLTYPNLEHRYQNQHSSPNNFERSNGVTAHVLLREMKSPGSTCSEPIPFKEAEFMQHLFTRRTTCENPASICPERIFKVVFVGDSAVGKTCFLHRFCHNHFKPLFSATIGVDFTVKTLSVRDRLVALQLWDTAGQERFRSITKQYFRKADGVVLMYDVTSETSFINVRNWIESVRIGVDDGCVLCLVGNKVDLYPNEHCRTITYQHGKDLANEFDMIFFETSAFSGRGIDECMQGLALRLQIREDEHMDEMIKLESMMGGGKKSWCCI